MPTVAQTCQANEMFHTLLSIFEVQNSQYLFQQSLYLLLLSCNSIDIRSKRNAWQIAALWKANGASEFSGPWLANIRVKRQAARNTDEALRLGGIAMQARCIRPPTFVTTQGIKEILLPSHSQWRICCIISHSLPQDIYEMHRHQRKLPFNLAAWNAKKWTLWPFSLYSTSFL